MYPHNDDIEKSVIGSLLLGKLDYIIKLTDKDFINNATLVTYKAIKYLYEKKAVIDVFTVADILKKRLEEPIDYLTSLMNLVPTAENIEHYIEKLKEYTLRREIIKASDIVKDLAENGDSEGIELKNTVQQYFDIKVYDNKKMDNTLETLINEVFKDIEKDYNATDDNKLFTNFFELDKIMAGLHPEEMTLIAARPGVGKSLFALQLAINLSLKGNKCLLVSREMSNTQMAKRLLANLSDVNGNKMRFCKSLTDQDWNDIAKTLNIVSQMPIELNDKLSTIQEIRAYVRELKNENNIDILFLDYLQLCKSMKKVENRRQEVEDISRQLKEISMEFSIPVVALSQLSRDGAKGEPELHHLRESGSLEQDADNVILLHIADDVDEYAEVFPLKIIIAKQRNGSTGSIYLDCYRKTFKLKNIVR